MMKYLLFFFLVFLLASCASPEIATPIPTPQAISVYYPASLRPWSDKLAGCAADKSEIALYFFQLTEPSTRINPTEIILGLGQPAEKTADSYISQVGWEQVVVIVNQTNLLSQLSTDKLKQIFSGRVTTWQGDTDGTIQVWVLPEGDPVRRTFDNALNQVQLLAPDAMLAPDPQAMLDAISKDEDAIGYVPQSYLNSRDGLGENKIKILRLEDAFVQMLAQPVLAFTQSNPTGYGRDLLLCLQNSSFH